MQDAFVGNWAQESHLSAEILGSLRDLNHRFLDLTASRTTDWVAGRVAPLSAAQRAAAAGCPYALFDAWHVASSAGLKAQLLLGMNGATAAAFRGITVNHLPALVATEAGYLSARWSGCTAYWGALTDAASRADPAALRRVQLYGLQLAAAARLSEP